MGDDGVMRALLVAVLAACSYSPRQATALDPDGPNTGDTPPLGDAVRAIDLVDPQVTGGPHVDFPLLISTTQPFLRDTGNGGDVTSADGFDIYFSGDPAGTFRLAHEVERYDAAEGQLIAWVKVPSLTASTVIYLHYGSDLGESQQDAPAVWSAGYVAVLHLADDLDSTGRATNVDVQTSEDVATQIGRGQLYDGSDDRIVVSSPSIDNLFTTGGTAQGWFFATGYGENGFGRIWDKGHTNGWSFGLDNGLHSMAFVHGDSDDFGEWNGPLDSVSLNSWHLGVVVYDKQSSANTPQVFVDGVQLQTLNVVDPPSGTSDSDSGNQLMVGNRGATDRTFQGMLDEVRMANVVKSPAWIATEYVNQAAPAAFYTISEPL
jgi:hypothetical protein